MLLFGWHTGDKFLQGNWWVVLLCPICINNIDKNIHLEDLEVAEQFPHTSKTTIILFL